MKNNIIVIGGATASGKSNLVLQIFLRLKERYGIDSEIVNADGMQVYNQLKLLTAQPSTDDLKLAPHNMYSILNPQDKISVVEWNQRANEVINRLSSENKVSIVVGGTGFYINSLCYGLPTVPNVPDSVRSSTRELFDKIGRDEFYRHLLLIDIRIRDNIKKGDTQRLLRAYEVYKFTGKSIIDFWKGPKEENKGVLKVFLNPKREEVINKIKKRIKVMLNERVLDEVMIYKENFGHIDSQLNHALGYQEFSMYLDGIVSLNDAIRMTEVSSCRYAKHQVTWFRNKMPGAIVLENSSNDSVNCIFDNFFA